MKVLVELFLKDNCYRKMLLKLSIVNTNSKVIFKTAITFVSEELSLTEFLASKKINLNDVCEIKTGDLFSNLTSVDINALEHEHFHDFKEMLPAKTMHLKVVVWLEFLSLVYDLNLYCPVHYTILL